MAWYDTDTSFNLASRMSEDFQKLRSGMGEKLTVISNYVGSAVICLSQALPLGWQLALVCMCMVPVTFASSILLSRMKNAKERVQWGSIKGGWRIIRSSYCKGGRWRELNSMSAE
ncbi:unnamed protein product [Plutella xylostella]|uniref:(diamondback moth) hypothetical protein n=1 Tax=Plutella xylostella TaxID=51655 RepID=A0A8S4D493_PLUXY|nr:unnamed protein product [Plutella xylostella]